MKTETATKHFAELIEKELARIEKIKSQKPIDYSKLDTIIVGMVAGDGIGPIIQAETVRVLRTLLAKEIKAKKIELRVIKGLTLENRIKEMAAIPADVLAEIKKCHVILKGPTTTPEAGSGLPNLESANVRLRKELDLFANVRPVSIPELGIDWCFFRENTEGAYAVGSNGIHVSDDLAIDFTVTTTQCTERIAKTAFDYAKKNGKTRVAVVTKANVVKATDGKFLTICKEVAKNYSGIEVESWYADIIAARLIDEKFRGGFQVFILPNLYGDIITDEAAQIQGGVGTAGGANLGSYYSMFEAIHGSAPRLVAEGKAHFADPRGIMRSAEMMLTHIGLAKHARKLKKALDTLPCGVYDFTETCSEYADKVIETIL